MAAGNNEKQANAGESGAQGGGSKKMILLMIVVALVAVILSVGVTWFLLAGSNESEAQPEEAAEAAAPTHAKALYLDIPPAFVVTYSHNNKQRYMQVFVTALARDPKAVEVMTLHLPLIRHQLNLLFGEQSFEALQTDEGKQTLRQKSVEVVNQLLEKEAPGVKIEQVMFTNFVMQ